MVSVKSCTKMNVPIVQDFINMIINVFINNSQTFSVCLKLVILSFWLSFRDISDTKFLKCREINKC